MNILTKLLSSRILQHLSFWGLSYYILLHVFSSSGQINPIDYIYTGVFQFTLAIGVYINLVVLIPLFLSKKQYFTYAILLIICLFGSTWFNKFMFSSLIDLILPGYYFISYYEFIDILKFFTAFIALTSLIKFSRGWFLLMEAKNDLAELQREKAQAELQILKAQVHPHFLFNSLNSIYSLALSKNESTPGVILKLADFLRYIIYDASENSVLLEKEIQLIRDYLDLQKLRTDQKTSINFYLEGDPQGKFITPLLFLPLLENSFKHGIKGDKGQPFIRIEMKINPDSLSFLISNNKGKGEELEQLSQGGIGLENLKRRLEVFYPGHHSLHIDRSVDIFRVELKIQWNEATELPDYRR